MVRRYTYPYQNILWSLRGLIMRRLSCLSRLYVRGSSVLDVFAYNTCLTPTLSFNNAGNNLLRQQSMAIW